MIIKSSEQLLNPDTARVLYGMLRTATDTERRDWWNRAAPDMQLWLVARVDPLEGFHAVYNIWHRTFKVEQYSTLNTVLELVSDFVRAAGRLPRFVTSADLEALAQGLQSDDEPYGKCTAILALALEYANRVNRTAGWYPPVAFEIWRSAKRNVPFCTNPNIAAEVLKMPIL